MAHKERRPDSARLTPELVIPEESAYVAQVNNAMKNTDVSFKVCQAGFKNDNVDRSRIMADVQMVPDGIYEIQMGVYQSGALVPGSRTSVRTAISDRAASRTGGPQYPVPLLT